MKRIREIPANINKSLVKTKGVFIINKEKISATKFAGFGSKLVIFCKSQTCLFDMKNPPKIQMVPISIKKICQPSIMIILPFLPLASA
jgi:hypothetical protein